MTDDDPWLIRLSTKDNIAVLGQTILEGEIIILSGQQVKMPNTLAMGHKLATQFIPTDTDILKYGLPIGYAAVDIPLGAHVHVHNLTSRYTAVEIME